jgi:mRNA interferase MazF
MGAFVNGDIVVVPFPFSAVQGSKRRPAIVMASWPFAGSTHYLLCSISSQRAPDPFLVPLVAADVEGGTLALQSYARPTYLFTADEDLITYRLGTLKADRLSEIVAKIVRLLVA